MLKYRADIDGLRALAIGPVVLYHFGFPGFGGGFVGVDIFFVISGFLITGILRSEIEAGNFSLIQFYDRRVRRIVPAYLIVCLTVFLVSLYTLMPEDLVNMAKSLVASLLFVANMYFASQMSYFQRAAGELPLLHLWSLSVEEQFYLVWPIFLYVFLRLVDRRWWSLGLIFLIVAGICITQWALQNKSVTAVFFFAPLRFWELTIGAYLALAPPPALTSRASRIVLGIFALLLIFGPATLYNSKWPIFPGLSALFPCLGAALVIYLGLHGRSELAPLLGSPPLRGLGLLSYSLYLWHWPVIAFFHVLKDRDPFIGEATALIGGSILLAYISWRYIEGPFRQRGADRILPGSRRIFSFAGGCFAILAALGVASIATQGFPGRGSTAFAAMKAAIPDNPVYEGCLRNREPEQVNKDITGCSWGVTTPKVSAVWGDSHAAAYFQGMEKFAVREGRQIRLLAMQSCEPLLQRARAMKWPAAQVPPAMRSITR